MREFNTSGPNIPAQHYTIFRTSLVQKGIQLVEKSRYFTIWAPRQTGKSTYFLQLADELRKIGYKVAHINFENYKNADIESFLSRLIWKLGDFWQLDFQNLNLQEIFQKIEENSQDKCVLIIDEVEGINQEYLNDFLHSIRNTYHSRESHCLKSVILVGVSNISGVIQDNASPFNIADNLDVPYFTNEEVYELLGQHETETGQLFNQSVKQKIIDITANQPGLVNGFARQLVERNVNQKEINYNHYLIVEDWYLTEAIDKNIGNILNKAENERIFIERLLFTEEKIPFKINKPSIKYLHANGLIKKDENGKVAFWVPLYKKAIYDAFYPYMNGEQKQISRTVYAPEYFTDTGELKLEKLINTYKEYVKRRGFKMFMEKDENGNYKSIKEAALIYSFETYINAIIQELKGKIYREANTGLGKSDMIINIGNNEFLIETKVFHSPGKFEDGKKQLSYYCNSLGLSTGLYLVFCPNSIPYPEIVKEQSETIEGVEILTYLIEYDETTW